MWEMFKAYDSLQVQNLIERCLQLYMNKEEVVKTLLNRARIDPGFTTLGRICDLMQISEVINLILYLQTNPEF